MIERKVWIQRMFFVEQEYRTALVSTTLLQERLRIDPSFLQAFHLSHRDAIRLRDNLESTYIVRLFAEFETGLRDAWERSFGRTSRPKMEDLLRAIAAKRAVLFDILNAADEVRLYRNALVHDPSAVNAQPIAIGEARDRLCRYFNRLPLNW